MNANDPVASKRSGMALSRYSLVIALIASAPVMAQVPPFPAGFSTRDIAADLMRDHTVIAPDLRGMGLSSHPDVGYDKKNEAADVAGVLDTLKIGKVDVVAHDDAFEQFKAFPQDATDNQASLANGKLSTPVLAIGGEKSYGAGLADVARAAFTNVQGAVIPDAGHWLMEEQPQAVIAAIRPFLMS